MSSIALLAFPGPKSVKSSVLKDGHVFVVHMLDPRDKEEVDGEGCDEKEKEEGGAEDNKEEEVTEKAEGETQEKDQREEGNYPSGFFCELNCHCEMPHLFYCFTCIID